MKLTTKFRLEPNFEQEHHLHNLCSIATKLYNTANFERRWVWENTCKIPNVYMQKKELKNNHWFKLLPSQTAQEVLFNLQQNYNSWFKLMKVDSTANPPKFRKKEMLSTISFYQQFEVIGGRIKLIMSLKYRKENNIKFIELPFTEWKQTKGIPKFCQIIFDKGKWLAHVTYEVDEQQPVLNDKVMAVDVGVINIAATTDTEGESRIYSGKQILAIQHYRHKEKSKLQSSLMLQYPKRHSSRAIRIVEAKAKRQTEQSFHTHSKNIISDCIRKGIKTLVVGDITNITKGKSFGQNNQKLHSWSFSKFIQQLEYKAVQAGMRFVRMSEAYTSQECSVCGTIRKSNRKKRGLYNCKICGSLINADVNGSKVMLKRYLRDFLSRSIGIVAMPSVARITNVCPS